MCPFLLFLQTLHTPFKSGCVGSDVVELEDAVISHKGSFGGQFGKVEPILSSSLASAVLESIRMKLDI